MAKKLNQIAKTHPLKTITKTLDASDWLRAGDEKKFYKFHKVQDNPDRNKNDSKLFNASNMKKDDTARHGYCSQDHCDDAAFDPKEETDLDGEQLDELKKSTLYSYVKKAGPSLRTHASVDGGHRVKTGTASKYHNKKAFNRSEGLKKAAERLGGRFETKETRKKSLGASSYPVRHYNAEEVELDETKTIKDRNVVYKPKPPKLGIKESKLSKTVKKALYGDDVKDFNKSKEKGKFLEKSCKSGNTKACKQYKDPYEETQLDEISKHKAARYVHDAAGSMRSSTWRSGFIEGRFKAPEDKWARGQKDTALRKAHNRQTGIERAAKRLAKEETDIDEAHTINQLKQARYYHSKEAFKGENPDGPGITRKSARHFQAYNAASRVMNKLKNRADVGFDSKSRNFTPKKQKNLKAPYNYKIESAEQIDELSTNTLKSYTKKAGPEWAQMNDDSKKYKVFAKNKGHQLKKKNRAQGLVSAQIRLNKREQS